MGLGDFFKNIFGKKTCAFCGGECGVMSRTKIKGDEYICSKCDDMCSNYIRKSRFTKPELEGDPSRHGKAYVLSLRYIQTGH